jgi:hypothetical protein
MTASHRQRVARARETCDRQKSHMTALSPYQRQERHLMTKRILREPGTALGQGSLRAAKRRHLLKGLPRKLSSDRKIHNPRQAGSAAKASLSGQVCCANERLLQCVHSVSAGAANSIFMRPLISPVLSNAMWKEANPLNLSCWSSLSTPVSTNLTTIPAQVLLLYIRKYVSYYYEQRRGSELKLALPIAVIGNTAHIPFPKPDPPPHSLIQDLKPISSLFPGAATANRKGSEYKYKSFRNSTYLFNISVSRVPV